ncbi:EscE/YscE/SsaE family type III secretion system needle protein co-chaperone [Chromobacterium piscinae]|uniref:EscE/YscE/SsaE family type III secretion system needle protein co-chaperone n=1 Tax=Chromobacterium piscinae TaxID=686831 RepID=UPI00320962CC
MHTLTELEDTLAADPNGRDLGWMLAALAAEAANLGLRQRQPQSAAAYAKLERQRLACLAAMRVVDTVWHRRHRGTAQLR